MRVPPHDLEAERALVGACLVAPLARDQAMQVATPGDLYDGQLRKVYATVLDLHLTGEPVDPATIAETLRREREPGDPQLVDVAWLQGVAADAPVSTTARRFAAVIAEHARRRDLISLAARVAEVGYDDQRLPLADGLADILRRLDAVQLPGQFVEPGPGVDEFLAGEDHDDWLIEHLLTRDTRMIVTGWLEGGGKSTFLRTISTQAAAGIFPLSTARPIEPLRVLYVDAENPPSIVRREFRPLRLQAGRRLDDPMRLVIKCRPEGLDLLHARDQGWLTALIEANRPDLVCIGPMYKLHESNPNDEEPARKLAAFFDRLRTRFRFALLIEAHTPQGEDMNRPMRPFGASLWRRWPEIGFGILKDHDEYKLVEWRNTRGGRGAWPHKLLRGGEWPWMADITTIRNAA